MKSTKAAKAKRIMREFSINEISAVDRPAQEPARATLLKRAEDTVATTEDQPEIIKGQEKMDKTTQDKIDALEIELAVAKAKLALTPEARAHCETLAGEAQTKFLSKSADEQLAIVTAVAEEIAKASEVVYTDAAGVTYTKKDDQRLIEMAKQRDALSVDIAKAKADAIEAQYVKRAEALAHLPGSEQARVALLKAVDTIPDEAARASALEILHAKSDAAAPAFKSVGHAGDSTETLTPVEELEKLAKAYAEAHKVSKAIAFDEVLKTAGGRALYAKAHG